MAILRVKNTGTTSDGTTWAKAYVTIGAALAVAASGDVIWVSSTHAGVYSVTTTLNAPSGGYVIIKCVSESGASGSGGLATGGTETLNTNNTSLTIVSANAQQMFIYGVTFVGNNGSSSGNLIFINSNIATASRLECYNCTFTTPGTSTSAYMQIGGGAASTVIAPVIHLESCTFNVRNAAGSGAAIRLGQSRLTILSPTIGYSGASKPTLLFGAVSSVSGIDCTITGDLSGYDASGGTIFSVASFGGGSVVFQGCRFHGTPTTITGTFASNSFQLILINCDSGDTKTVFEYRTRLGTILESEAIYASDGETISGVNVSWQVATTADCNESNPFVLPPLIKYHGATSAVNVDVEFLHDSATDMHDRNIWMTTTYPSSASYPTFSCVKNRNSDPFEGTAVDRDNTSTTWAGSGYAGLSNPNKQRLRNSLTPAEVGQISSVICVGVASKTLYIDPKQRIA